MKVILAALLMLIAAPLARADVDHEQARRAYEAGEIVSLKQILKAVAKDQPGQVVEVELEREDGRWVYEVEVLSPAGKVTELLYDGKTGKRMAEKP